MKKLFLGSIIVSIILLCICCSKPVKLPEIRTHKIMSFNIRYGTAADAENSWSNRKDVLLEVISDNRPDILGVQEALDFQLEEIAAALPYLSKSGAGRDDGLSAGEHSALFINSKRYRIIREETFWFSERPQKPGSISWGANFPRICSWVELADSTHRQHIFVFNNHWDHESQLSRDSSAHMLINKINALGISSNPLVIMGDFNAGESNPAFLALLNNPSVKLIDTFRQIKPRAQNVGTFNGFKGDSLGQKIDAILVSAAFKVIDARIVHMNRNGSYPSDHFPVTTTLLIE